MLFATDTSGGIATTYGIANIREYKNYRFLPVQEKNVRYSEPSPWWAYYYYHFNSDTLVITEVSSWSVEEDSASNKKFKDFKKRIGLAGFSEDVYFFKRELLQ